MTEKLEDKLDGRQLILCDIDGCLLKHHGDLNKLVNNPTILLDGVREKLQEWYLKDYKIVLTTGRQESMREFTEQQLAHNNIFYHSLIMDVGRGARVVINDRKPGSDVNTAIAVNLERNVGMKGLEV